MKNSIVVTRHPALVDYIREKGMVSACALIFFSHVTKEDVQGVHVIGDLSKSLAVYAASVTEIPLDIPDEFQGKLLSLDQVRKFARPAFTFVPGQGQGKRSR